MELGALGLDGIPGSGNGFGSDSLDVETSMQKWATRSEGFKQEGSVFFGGDVWRASKMAKTDADFSLASGDAHMLRFSSTSKLETSALPYFHPMEAAQYKNSGYYSSGGLDNSTGVHLLSGVRARGPFTPSQWLELEQQALIYKYITANEPIPIHLLIPIRKAFESAGFYGLNGATLKPTAWGWDPFHLGYSNNTDPEPGRCRRTDGKKWRCSRDAVVNQKYCEKHTNRGRHRSRKHVEGQVTKSSTTKPMPPSVSSSNSFDINQHQHFQGESLQPTEPNPNMNASLNRMIVNRESSDQKLQDATQISFLSRGINLNCSGSSFTISNHQLCSQEPALNGYGSYTHVLNDAGEPESQNSLCTFLDDWHKNQSSADFMSSTSSPTNEKAAVGVSPLRSFQEHEIGLGFGSGNWKPITWEASMGGPLAEALQSSSISNNTTDGIGSYQVSSSSPNGVLQRSTPVSLSNSSAGSSPRADNSKTIESGGS